MALGDLKPNHTSEWECYSKYIFGMVIFFKPTDILKIRLNFINLQLHIPRIGAAVEEEWGELEDSQHEGGHQPALE